MTTMAVIVFLALAAIAAAHVAWGFGANWPAANRDDLFHLVIGATNGVVRLPVPEAAATALGVMVALVFAGRGIAPYTSAWRRRFSKEPFASMDRSWYGPFCLLLAVCFAILVIKRVVI
jgi:hypothetical protein